MDEARIKTIYDLTLIAWKWYKTKSQIPPSKRDDYFWKCVAEDIKKETKKLDNINIKGFMRDIMIAYMNELQGEYCEWLSTKQERLPL